MSYNSLEKIINESFEKKEKVSPKSDKKFFAKGEGPYWWHKDNFHALPYINITKKYLLIKNNY